MTDVASVNVSVGSFETLKVGITTWNVGNAQPLQSEVPLLLGGKDELSSLDMIIVGAQEATYKPVDEAKLVEKLAQKRGDGGRGSVLEDGKALEDHHHHAAQEHFYDILIAYCSKLGFSEVKRQSLGEMRLIVFAQEKHVKHISNVQTATAACGIAHMLKNKGGIIISMDFKSNSVAFVSSHLAAHLKNFARRNSDVKEILDEARINNKRLDASTQFDYVFWIGDLNYRVDLWTARGQDKPDEKGETHEKHWGEVKALVDAKKWGEIMQGDQLQREQRAGNVYMGFSEPEYNFLPTFKVERLVDTTHKKQRSPAYCDRILWKTQPYLKKYNPIAVESFKGVEKVSTSDHKPVRGVFGISLVPPIDCNISDEDTTAKITITNVRGEHLEPADVTGASDPYLVLNMVPAKAMILPKGASELRTTHKNQTLHPVYDNKEIPAVLTRCKTIEELKSTVFILTFFDYDMASVDDDLGSAVISFEDSLGGAKEGETFEFDFKHTLTLGSKKLKGEITGKITIEWGKDHAAKAVTNGEGCCSIS